ncbi:hypothetical protein HPP92_009490 [Vanilla planifolia]|uniref:Uncharacterized protein n=1 Tax=Vanilla planifolia TaxID=51239 RepID=A0A835V705_VANPL|nr:hypothetical protein HPP92_009490 [Vanilla planifolia]
MDHESLPGRGAVAEAANGRSWKTLSFLSGVSQERRRNRSKKGGRVGEFARYLWNGEEVVVEGGSDEALKSNPSPMGATLPARIEATKEGGEEGRRREWCNHRFEGKKGSPFRR